MIAGNADVAVEDLPDTKTDDTVSGAKTMSGKTGVHWIWIVIAAVEALIIAGYIGYIIWNKKIKK